MNNNNRFDKQLAIVTGGASGIGFAVGERLAAEGAKVVLVDIEEEKLTEAKQLLKAYEGQIGLQTCNIADEVEVKTLFQNVYDKYGAIDIVINCAGIAGPTGTKITDYNVEAFKKVLDVNLTGTFLMTKYAVETMLPNNYGRILMLASMAGKDGNPGMAGYTSSKAGVIGLVKGIAKEFAETGITVNGLAPALIATPLNLKTAKEQLDYMKKKIPMGRLGTVDEVAALACWIVSKEASFNTGVIFDMSGGRATY